MLVRATIVTYVIAQESGVVSDKRHVAAQPVQRCVVVEWPPMVDLDTWGSHVVLDLEANCRSRIKHC
jgi:hypothetical protein